MTSTEEFKKWLDSENGNMFSFKENNASYGIMKVPKADGFYYLYTQCNYGKDSIVRNRRFEYSGIYNQEDGLIYDSHGYFRKLFPEMEHNESLGQMSDTVTDKVQRLIWQTIGNDRSKLSITELSDKGKESLDTAAKYSVDGKARELFLQGVNSSEAVGYTCDFQFGGWSESDLLEYIRNPPGFIERQAREYIDTHQEDILWEFQRNDLVAASMKRMEANEDSPLYRLRNIMAVMNNLPAKTVSVTVCKEGTEFTFKTDACELRRDPFSYYSTLNMAAPDRRQFESLYGRHSNYTPEEITDISYRGSSVYSGEPYEPDQDEDEVFTMSM